MVPKYAVLFNPASTIAATMRNVRAWLCQQLTILYSWVSHWHGVFKDAYLKANAIYFTVWTHAQGMGEPADNADAVLCTANALTDRQMFSLAKSKITISTVAPDAKALAALGGAPALLAWSVHAVKDSLRLQLVPTTKVCQDLRTKYYLSGSVIA